MAKNNNEKKRPKGNQTQINPSAQVTPQNLTNSITQNRDSKNRAENAEFAKNCVDMNKK